MKTCPNCNAQCADDVIFCTSCGSKLNVEQPKAAEPEKQAPAPSFCKACGNPLEPGAAFCPKCGTGTTGKAPAAPAQASAGMPPIIQDTLTPLKTFVTKGPDAAVGAAAKSKGLGFAIIAGVSMLAFMFALPTNMIEMFGKMIVDVGAPASYAAEGANMMHEMLLGYPWGLGLVWSLLIWIVLYGGISAAMYLAVKVIHKKDIHFFNVFNMVAVAGLPITAACLVNMLLGLLWTPLVLIVSTAAMICTLILLFNGMQRLGGFEKRPTITFAACIAAVLAIIILVVGIIVTAKLSTLLKDMIGGTVGGFGGGSYGGGYGGGYGGFDIGDLF